MNHPWAIQILTSGAAPIGHLRLFEGIEVGADASDLWLRGKRADERLAAALSRLPALARYEWQEPDALRLLGKRVPARRLPAANWQPIAKWAKVIFPISALPGLLPETSNLKLVRNGDERAAELLLTSIQEFASFAANAAAIRLDPLRFAMNSRGEVLIQGTPLPPIRGARFALHGRIGVPIGFHWSPAVSASALEQKLQLGPEVLAVWNEDGAITRLGVEQFVACTRSAVRATLEAWKERG